MASVKQSYVRWINFALKDVAPIESISELRDGVKLSQFMSVVCQNHEIMSNLKRGTSLMDTRANVTTAVRALRTIGASFPGGEKLALSRIMSGDESFIMALLWQLLIVGVLPRLVDVRKIELEIAELNERWHEVARSSLERRTSVVSPLYTSTADDADQENRHVVERIELLLRWCRYVCSLYSEHEHLRDVRVTNFTTSFADGRAMCILLHHYFPQHMALGAISAPPPPPPRPLLAEQQPRECASPSQHVNARQTWAKTFDIYHLPTQRDLAIRAYKANYALIHASLKAINDVPYIVRVAEVLEAVPDERTTVVVTAHFFARAMREKEITAALRAKMATVLQRAWRRKCVRSLAGRKTTVRSAAATTVQKVWRSVVQRRRFNRLRAAACVVQRTCRSWLARREVAIRLKRIVAIQTALRKHGARAAIAAQRREGAAAVVHRAWRARAERLHLRRVRRQALRVRSAIAAYLCANVSGPQRSAIVAIIAHTTYKDCGGRCPSL
eukprot:gnl/Spiro4/22985_TR11351_c0_g1_i1.p1 gnl/Spiro4/22985_TR11351_c0_g1~~gnl/Spiro4/22985_TR11351_c0_g1_i1.p1  ORF type:complete len:528 (-),score=110.14 gnl/Spiro4/22985_TR11351_c0_g1_i1:155-1657(-)